MANDVYSAADIIGKSLIAVAPVSMYDLPFDNANIIGTVPPGQTVGVVYSWIDADPADGRTVLFWQFQSDSGSFFYTKQIQGLYDLSALQQQGVQTTQEKNMGTVETLIRKYGPYVLAAILAGAAIKGFFSRPSTNK